jgi:biopolymer transport protein TolR
MGGAAASGGTGRRRGRRRGGKAVMSDINVTPMVDVMLVLLIIFMVSAPMLSVGVPVDMPKTKAKSLSQDNQPLTVSLNGQGQIFLQNSEIPVDQLVDKLKAVTAARGGGLEENIRVRGDKSIQYGVFMQVMGRLSEAGFTHVGLVTESAQGK